MSSLDEDKFHVSVLTGESSFSFEPTHLHFQILPLLFSNSLSDPYTESHQKDQLSYDLLVRI